jgi:hypothetical protein
MRTRILCLLELAIAAVGCGSHAALNQTQSGGYIPSDMAVAVGPHVVMQGVNSTFAWYARNNGQLLAAVSASDFFGPHGMCSNAVPTQGASDPRIRWDPASQRFFVVSTETASPGRWCLAVSTDPDGLIGWHFYAFQPPAAWFGGGWGYQYVFPDFPGIGVGDTALLLTGNLANTLLNLAAVDRSAMLLINKADLVAGSPTPRATYFAPAGANVTGDTTHLFLLQPSDHLSPGAWQMATGVNVLADPGNHMRTYRIIGTPGDPTTPYPIEYDVYVDSLRPFYQPPTYAKQIGGLKVRQIDDRVMYVTYRSGQLWVTLNQGVYNSGDADNTGALIRRTGVRLMQLDPSSPNVVYQDFKIKAAKQYYYVPSILIDAQGNLIVAMNWSSAKQGITGVVTGRRPTDPPNTARPPTVVANSPTAYGDAFIRWGDYSAIADDEGGVGFWAGLGYAIDASHWGTFLSHANPGNGYPQN